MIDRYSLIVEAVYSTALENKYTEEETQALLREVLKQYDFQVDGEK